MIQKTQANRKKVLFYPLANSRANAYIGHVTQTISDKIFPIGLDVFWKIAPLSIFNASAVHFNWIENVKGHSTVARYLNYFLRVLLIDYFRLLRKPIVWTAHNKVSHDAESSELSLSIIKKIAAVSTRIHCLSRETVDLPEIKPWRDKCVFIPHGDYLGDYGHQNIDLHKKYNIPPSHQILLFVGLIRPYKNIELLIDAFKRLCKTERYKTISLLIVGRCESEEYASSIEQSTEDAKQNIHIDMQRCPDECLADYLEQSASLVAPYNTRSSLNSGVLWMASTFKKTMIMPEIECVRDMPQYQDCGYYYTYSTPEEHPEALYNALCRFAEDLLFHPDILQNKQERCFEYMMQNTWKAHHDEWVSLYDFDNAR